MTTFIDTNVVIAILNQNEPHHAWSVEQLESCKAKGPAIISDIVYSELSAGMTSKDEVDEVIFQLSLERISNEDVVLYRAGQAFKKYKNTTPGTKTNVLPDFLIGAAAEIFEAPLLTANPKDFAGYFPAVQLIKPDPV